MKKLYFNNDDKFLFKKAKRLNLKRLKLEEKLSSIKKELKKLSKDKRNWRQIDFTSLFDVLDNE